MTQNEIIEMAREAGLYQDINVSFHQALRNFYDLVANKAFQDGYEKGIAAFDEAVSLEREACEKVCEHQPHWVACVAAIRARGEQA